MDDTNTEIEALVAQIQVLKDLVAKSRANTSVSPQDKQRFDVLQRSAQEKDLRIKQLEEFKILYHRAQSHVHELQLEQQRYQRLAQDNAEAESHRHQLLKDNQQLQSELRNALIGTAELKEELETLYSQMESLKATLSQSAEVARALEVAEAKRQHAAEQCRARTEQLQNLEHEIESVRASMTHATQMFRDLEARYQGSIKEKADLVEQAERARQSYQTFKEELKSKDDLLIEAQQAKQRAKQQLTAMEQQLGDSQRQQCNLQMALTDLRRDRESLLKSKSTFEVDLKKVQQERASLESKLQQALEERTRKATELQQQIDKTLFEQGQREAIEAECNGLQTTLQQARDTLAHAEANQHRLSTDCETKERRIEELDKLFGQLKREKGAIDDELNALRRTLEIRENDLQTAQQHLAKKVKESARLNERVDEAEKRTQELEQARNELRTRLTAMDAELEKERKREAEIETRCQQRILEAQGAATHWEREYARIAQQLVQAEEANKRLRELEAKYNQVSSVLANLGQFFTPPAATAAPAPTPVAKPEADLPKEQPQASPEEQDLFSSTQPQRRPKRNLFDT